MTVESIQQIFRSVEQDFKPATPDEVRQQIISSFSAKSDLTQALDLIPIMLASFRKTFSSDDYYLLETIVRRLEHRARRELEKLIGEENEIQSIQ